MEDDDLLDEYGDPTESATVECPACGSEVYEDVIRCPVCNEYVTAGGNGIKMHWRMVALGLLVLGLIWLVNRINLLLGM